MKNWLQNQNSCGSVVDQKAQSTIINDDDDGGNSVKSAGTFRFWQKQSLPLIIKKTQSVASNSDDDIDYNFDAKSIALSSSYAPKMANLKRNDILQDVNPSLPSKRLRVDNPIAITNVSLSVHMKMLEEMAAFESANEATFMNF
jgi:hypothetical protein